MIQYHKIFGKVEVLNFDENITVLRLQDGTEKKVLTAYTTLSDTNITDKVAIAKEEKRQTSINAPKMKIADMLSEINDHKKFDFITKKYV